MQDNCCKLTFFVKCLQTVGVKEGKEAKKRAEKVGINPTISRHGIAQARLALLIWLNEMVPFSLSTSFCTHVVTYPRFLRRDARSTNYLQCLF